MTPAVSLRSKVFALEKQMLEREQLDLPVRHLFEKGVYARELFIPKGTLLTGKIHKTPQINVMSRGDLSVLTERGVVRLKAPPMVIVASPAGTKRIAYAHEDTVWTTIHGTDESDLDKIEAQFIAQTDDEFRAFIEQARLKEIAPCHG